MEKKEQFFSKQENEAIDKNKNNLEHAGLFNLSTDELDLLSQELHDNFEKHPTFEGVEIKKLDIDKIPADIQKMIGEINGSITLFVAIKIAKEVPIHQHTADAEIYFGGDNGSVLLLDSSKKEIGQFSLGDKNFTAANIGEWHGVTSQSGKGATFFGVKYTIEK